MKLLYFAWVRERIGVAEEDISIPPDVRTVDNLLAWLASQSDGHAAALVDSTRLRIAVNQTYVRGDQPLHDSDEIAIFPPVTGG